MDHQVKYQPTVRMRSFHFTNIFKACQFFSGNLDVQKSRVKIEKHNDIAESRTQEKVYLSNNQTKL